MSMICVDCRERFPETNTHCPEHQRPLWRDLTGVRVNERDVGALVGRGEGCLVYSAVHAVHARPEFLLVFHGDGPVGRAASATPLRAKAIAAHPALIAVLGEGVSPDGRRCLHTRRFDGRLFGDPDAATGDERAEVARQVDAIRAAVEVAGLECAAPGPDEIVVARDEAGRAQARVLALEPAAAPAEDAYLLGAVPARADDEAWFADGAAPPGDDLEDDEDDEDDDADPVASSAAKVGIAFAFVALLGATGLLLLPGGGGAIADLAGALEDIVAEAPDPEPEPTPAVEAPRPDMVRLAGGRLRMGSTPAEIAAALSRCRADRRRGGCDRRWFADETPVREMEVAPFWLDADEVTNAEYEACVGAGACPARVEAACYRRQRVGYSRDGRLDRAVLAPERPAVCVTWPEAAAWCRWSGARLPTEPETEWAARSDDATLKQVTGGVWEWQDTAYASRLPAAPRPCGSAEANCVRKGGSDSSRAVFARPANRAGSSPGRATVNVGFRCARGESGEAVAVAEAGGGR